MAKDETGGESGGRGESGGGGAEKGGRGRRRSGRRGRRRGKGPAATGDSRPTSTAGESQGGERKPSDRKSGDRKPNERKASDRKPKERQASDGKAGERRRGPRRPPRRRSPEGRSQEGRRPQEERRNPEAAASAPAPKPRAASPVELKAKKGFHRFDDVRDCFERVLNVSVADETELVWLERRRAVVNLTEGPDAVEKPRLSVLVRVVDGGRQGWYRTDTADSNLLESGVRQALALSKAQKRFEKRPILPTDEGEMRAPQELYDRDVGRLLPGEAQSMLRDLCGEGENAQLAWSEARLVIHNSHGLRRSAALSEVSLEVRSGEGLGAAYAAGSARRLAELNAESIRDRARALRVDGSAGELPDGPVPVLLSPEASVECLNVVNAHAFSGRSFLEGTSFLSKHRNIQVFDNKIYVRDDGTTGGLAFPFDFEGSLKSPHELIIAGKPSTPALSRAQGFRAGLESTANSVGGQDAMFSNLFMMPGEANSEELLRQAEGGLAIGWLEPVECFEPQALRIRAIARGVRRVRDGALAEPLPDLIWEASLLASFGRLRAVGQDTVIRAMPTTPLGGISAPALVLAETGGFSALW